MNVKRVIARTVLILMALALLVGAIIGCITAPGFGLALLIILGIIALAALLVWALDHA